MQINVFVYMWYMCVHTCVQVYFPCTCVEGCHLWSAPFDSHLIVSETIVSHWTWILSLQNTSSYHSFWLTTRTGATLLLKIRLCYKIQRNHTGTDLKAFSILASFHSDKRCNLGCSGTKVINVPANCESCKQQCKSNLPSKVVHWQNSDYYGDI